MTAVKSLSRLQAARRLGFMSGHWVFLRCLKVSVVIGPCRVFPLLEILGEGFGAGGQTGLAQRSSCSHPRRIRLFRQQAASLPLLHQGGVTSGGLKDKQVDLL